MELPLPDLASPPPHSAAATQIGKITASSVEPPIISAALFPWATPTITFYCTVSPACAFSCTTFEDWVAHEVDSHPGAHSLWHCDLKGALPSTVEDRIINDPQGCDLAFASWAEFAAHYVSHHHPIDTETGAGDIALEDADFFLGPQGTLGGDYGQFYWCGFCKKTLPCNMMGDWKIDRFEHIAAHFHPMHARFAHFEMEEWKFLPLCRDKVQRPVNEEQMMTKAGLKVGKPPPMAIVSAKDMQLQAKDEKERAMIRKRVLKGMRKERIERKKASADATGKKTKLESQANADDADDEANADKKAKKRKRDEKDEKDEKNEEEEEEEEDGEDEENEEAEPVWEELEEWEEREYKENKEDKEEWEDKAEWEEWMDKEKDEEGRDVSSGFASFGEPTPNQLPGDALAQEIMTAGKGKEKEQAIDAAEEFMWLGMLAVMDQDEDMEME